MFGPFYGCQAPNRTIKHHIIWTAVMIWLVHYITSILKPYDNSVKQCMPHPTPFTLISPFVFHGRKQLIRNDKQVSCYFRLNYCVNREVEDSKAQRDKTGGVYGLASSTLSHLLEIHTNPHRVLKHFSKLWEKVHNKGLVHGAGSLFGRLV